MKTFVVFYIAGQVGGFVGPLPYDMSQCLARRLDPITKNAEAWTFIHNGIERTKDGKTVRVMCEERDGNPVITFGAKP